MKTFFFLFRGFFVGVFFVVFNVNLVLRTLCFLTKLWNRTARIRRQGNEEYLRTFLCSYIYYKGNVAATFLFSTQSLKDVSLESLRLLKLFIYGILGSQQKHDQHILETKKTRVTIIMNCLSWIVFDFSNPKIG